MPMRPLYGGLGPLTLPRRAAAGASYLLDLVPGATMALGLRRLSSSYAGSCIRVRRSSDNAEQDIGFSGANLDTAALLTFVGANSGTVVTWYDQAGNGNNATQAGPTLQPLVVSSGSLLTAGANARPVARGDGSNDRLECSAFAGGALARPYSILTVTKQNSFAAYGTITCHSTLNGITLGAGSTPNAHYLYNGTVANITGLGAVTTLQMIRQQWSSTTASADAYVNNGSAITLAVGSVASSLVGLTLYNTNATAGNFPAAADIGEVLVYPGTLSSGDHATIKSDQNAYWAAY